MKETTKKSDKYASNTPLRTKGIGIEAEMLIDIRHTTPAEAKEKMKETTEVNIPRD